MLLNIINNWNPVLKAFSLYLVGSPGPYNIVGNEQEDKLGNEAQKQNRKLDPSIFYPLPLARRKLSALLKKNMQILTTPKNPINTHNFHSPGIINKLLLGNCPLKVYPYRFEISITQNFPQFKKEETEKHFPINCFHQKT
ncbi:hypothetical protein O181_016100 [Austropuccinia psidii MF-1]|uniref:Uncharacterized protein n=1 Tax=Austropuccinia psidii MF-1 TaxID=1389203 RepID=A0A9Q3C547_9BASI|nr:hypothetical protein [Austropuccinia psidii MF-1]